MAESASGEAVMDGGGISGSAIRRLWLHDENRDGGVSSVVCKLTDTRSLDPLPLPVRLITVLMDYHRWDNLPRETLFYSKLAPAVKRAGLRFPQCKLCRSTPLARANAALHARKHGANSVPLTRSDHVYVRVCACKTAASCCWVLL